MRGGAIVTWVGWRLQRTETLVVLGILALLAALMIPTGIQIANAYHHDGLSACTGLKVGSPCDVRVSEFQSRFQTSMNLANFFTLVPGLIGVVLAAPFILDLEHGTYRLAWTQGITRGRWLLGKLGLPLVAALVASAVLIVLFTWWRTPQANLNGRLDTGIYDTAGIVVPGYTLFALGLALAIGAVWRRSAVALTVAFVGYFAVRIVDDLWLRNQLVSPLHRTWRGTGDPRFLYHANILRQTVYIDGHRVGSSGGGIVSGHSKLAVPVGAAANTVFHAVYQPASDFWPMQLTETGLFAGVAALLIAFAAWWTHERVA
jgi:hypothetical protein